MTETIEPTPTPIDQQQLVEERVDKARAEGIDFVGPEGCSTMTVLKIALEPELSEHLGYDEHYPAGGNWGNTRYGIRRAH